MRTSRKALTGILTLAMVTVLAMPAAAVTTPAIVTFSGIATITTPLFYPGVGTSPNASWTFATGWFLPHPFQCSVIGAGGVDVGGCSISASGDLGPVASPANIPLGPWCGFSSGTDGAGTLTSWATKSGTIALSNVGWISAGSILVIDGRWSEGNSKGEIVGIAQAFGGDQCTFAGSQNFNVVGITALL